ncbi:uncharacterized protein JN550_001281 [Neoarthrinium moseri]|uniref:uncharacterized protein n=1 Tax=Neoarthrinium moseri TaxID=1658444 RepID=UPI001FDDEBAB|nr:uncharacterized protein JN550_001281 [Neoarthrinium moseri]KAI1877209.1 hypothetical protein JN550_001281 [Neoarthrinium moseri]
MTLPFPRPPSLAAGFTLSRCTPDDIPQMVSVYLAAFTSTKFTYWWPSSVETVRRWNEARFRLYFRDPTDQQFKVVDDTTGQVVGFSHWKVPAQFKGLVEGFRTYDDRAEGEFDGSVSQWMQNPPEGSKEDLYHEFFAGIKAMGAKWNIDEKLDLTLLCVHPAYHRRGIGAALLNSVSDVAHAEGVTTYLEALDNAVPVYKRYGFKTVDKLEYDLTKAGKDGKAIIDVMLREPNGSGQSGA